MCRHPQRKRSSTNITVCETFCICVLTYNLCWMLLKLVVLGGNPFVGLGSLGSHILLEALHRGKCAGSPTRFFFIWYLCNFLSIMLYVLETLHCYLLFIFNNFIFFSYHIISYIIYHTCITFFFLICNRSYI